MRKKWSWRAFFRSNLFFAVCALSLLLLSVSLTRAQIKDRSIRREIARLQSDAEALEGEQESHRALISLTESPEFLEGEARRSLGYARPGEKVVVVEKGEGEEQARQARAGMSNPQKWWHYFFGS